MPVFLSASLTDPDLQTLLFYLFFFSSSTRNSSETIQLVFNHFVCLFDGMRLRLVSLREHFFLSVFSLGVSAKKQHEDRSRQQELVWSKTVREQLALQGKVALETGMIPLTPHPTCLLYTSPSPRDIRESRMPSSA